MVISLSLNDFAQNILNDVLKIYGLVGSLLFNGFCVFDGFLVSVILSTVISPTCGMVMCFSSSQVSILHLQNDVLILFSFGCFFDRISSCFCQAFFNMLFVCIRVFSHKKDICHWATASIVVADGFVVLAFWGILHHSLLMSSFLSKFCSHSKSSTMCDSHADSAYTHIFHPPFKTGPLNMFTLFSSWICVSRQPHKVTSGQITVTVSSQTKTQVKCWLIVIHSTQSVANIPA